MGFPSNRDAITALKSKKLSFLKVFLSRCFSIQSIELYNISITDIYKFHDIEYIAVEIFTYIIGLPTCFVCTNYGKPIKTSIHMVEHTR